MKFPSTGPLAALLTLGLAGACSILPESEPVQLLDPAIPAPEPAAREAGWGLSVTRPESDPMRDSNRVLVRTAEGRLQVHPSARWTAAAPDLVRTLLVRHLRDAGRLEQVSAGAAGLEHTLALDLRRFELDETGANRLAAEIRIEARLYNNRTSSLMTRRLFQARSAIEEAVPGEIIDGFEAALGEIVPALSEWVIGQGQPADESVEG